MWRAALDAADYALVRFEERLDRLVGREARLAVGRYTALVFIGAPVAWALSRFHWGTPATLGLVVGVLLYALADIGKHLFSAKPKL